MTARVWTVRPFEPARDGDAVQRLDTSYTSDARYHVRADGERWVLEPVAASPAVTQRYAIDLAADDWQHAYVAELDGRVRGFVAWGEQAWNRRLAIWHFYVDLAARRLGGGRRLMDAALAGAVSQGLGTIWIETSNLNQPAIAAYRRLRFEICGFDTTLYHGVSPGSEFAIYMARAVVTPARPTPG